MTKEELREKRNLAIENLNYAIAILGSDELYIDELEQENAELKEQNIKDCENFNKTMREIKEQWNKEHYQRIKAKEIIKTLVADLSMYSGDYQKELLEAKQFLKLDNDEIYEHIQKAKYNYIN